MSRGAHDLIGADGSIAGLALRETNQVLVKSLSVLEFVSGARVWQRFHIFNESCVPERGFVECEPVDRKPVGWRS